MRRQLIATLPLLALAACGESNEVSLENAAPSEVAEKAAAAGAMRFDPGQWETRIEVVDVEMPGMPDAMRDQAMKTMQQTATTVTSCITPDQAADPEANVFTGSDGQCRYEKFEMANGRIEGTMTCSGGPQGGTMRFTTEGTFTATSFTMENRMTSAGATGAPEMRMTSKVVGRRIGECKA